ncbi:MAG: molybdopterin-dependent oxidoreductase [Planctomycetaceae bacterium]|nr:molybdopterin-dependent oxidoreductase [Planctomycetaceae bacterium]
MVKVKVNDIEVDADPKDNCILAARKAGVEIPHYCWHESLSVVASCRMCLVEVGETKPDGTVAMGPKLVPGCQTPIKEGTIIRTDSAKVKTSQQMTLELLLLNHPLDCSICDQAGECYLQDYTYKYGNAHSRLDEPKLQREDKYHIGEQIALFTDRCVMCTRCVRFTREVSGTAELQVVARGSHEEIDVFPDTPCNNKLAGNVVDLCPVGALCSKDFLYKKRVWWLKHAESVCTGCSTGCSIHVDQNENKVYRLRPRENPQAQGHFMCDEGRFGFKYIHDDRRLKFPKLKNAASGVAATGTASQTSDLSFADPWPTVLGEVKKRIRQAIQNDPSGFVAVLSPLMTVEEAYLLASYIKGIDPRTKLTLGPVPMVGSDDLYPKGPKGEPPAPGKVKFTIRAEKCPNRLGVEAVLRHFERAVIHADSLGKSSASAWYVVGGYSAGWVTESLDQAIGTPSLLIVQDIFPSPLSDRADIVLAAGSFAEREGTYVNHAGLAQAAHASIRPPEEARADGRILMELAGRSGLFNAMALRKEIGTNIAEFSAIAIGDLGEHGVRLAKYANQTVGARS